MAVVLFFTVTLSTYRIIGTVVVLVGRQNNGEFLGVMNPLGLAFN